MEIRIKQLIGELKLAEITYRMSSLRMSDQPVKDQLITLAERKMKFMKSFVDQHEETFERMMLEVLDTIKPEHDKLEIELDHVLLQGWETEILDYCLERERKIEKLYKELITDPQYDDFLKALLMSQLTDTTDIMNELEDTKAVFESIFSLETAI
ncbi:hypothetical protein [Reichenbachiella sp.]|uniref:hypothetical protein n=1 Tax=Reichenbachiella sp. TaxID=2184521 RepID=UPI003BB05CB6